jgi:hypothetical protein
MTPKRLLVAIAIVWGITGLVEPHLPNAGEPFSPIGMVQGFVTALLLFGWCKAHAEAHAIKPPLGAPLLVGLLAPIGIPYYAFRGYGLRGGARLIGLAVVALVAFAAIYLGCFEFSAWSAYLVTGAFR